MSIRVGKYNYQTKKQPITKGFTNILIHTTGELSPYEMMDKDNVIMETHWQFSKAWTTVEAIKQPLSQWHPEIIRWEHGHEIHFKDGVITPEYWAWRHKGFHHNRWVRYPNGYKLHGKAIGSVIGTPDNYEIVGYIEARKRIYFTKYREIAIETDQYKDLKERLANGENIQINEVDGPKYTDEYPYNLVKDSSLEMNEEILRNLINNESQAFGHGYTLAACLLDIDLSTDSPTE
jgi:hypothetical protein